MATASAARKVKRGQTPVPVRFNEEERGLLRLIETRANAESRSVSGQLKYYARLGMIAKDNPDLPMAFIEDILIAQEESKAGMGQPYAWGVTKG
jgi:hypothetical protein